MSSGELIIDLENVPRPQSVPYEVRVTFRPASVETLGYIQPDGSNRIDSKLSVHAQATAPLDYYYGLALSYVYMEPSQCQDAIPWLLKSVELDPAGYNPAWVGFNTCPTENAPPTPIPIPTFTPTPGEASTQD
jgi:hypothetical protein